MAVRSSGSRLDKAPKGMLRPAAVATRRARGGAESWSITAAASAVLPMPASPTTKTPAPNCSPWSARFTSARRATNVAERFGSVTVERGARMITSVTGRAFQSISGVSDH